jgi:hypothetical protein
MNHRAYLAVFFALFLSACSFRLSVEILNANTLAPTFKVSAPWFAEVKGYSRVKTVDFFKVIDGVADYRNPLWSISSAGVSVTSLTYGVLPPGFQQSNAPAPLEHGKTYEVSVRASGGGGGLAFTIAPNNSFKADSKPLRGSERP